MTNTTSTTRRLRWSSTAVAVALALVVSGCGGSTDSAGTDGSTTPGTTTPSASATSPTTGSTASGSEVASLAEAFAATLDEEQLASLNQEYSFENAVNWSNLPNGLLTGEGFGGGGGMPTGEPPAGMSDGAPSDGERPTGMAGGGPGGASSTGRVGLQTDSLDDEQWTALEDLLRAATGSAEDEGFDEIVQHLAADDYLADNGGGDTYGRGQYFIAFLGTPSDSGTWELQFGGHHLAVANTYVDGALGGATPSFRGIEPLETVEVDGTTVQPERQEREAFASLLGSLDADQLATAQLAESYNDLLLGPGNDWAFPESSEGIAASELTDEQKDLLLAAIATYVDDVDDADAAEIMATYRSQLDETYLSWSGTTSVTDNGDYVRIDGPQVWIEFSMQSGIVLDGAHPHAVWRDKATDYAGTTA